ncbi:ABC transporter permease [Paenibacillus pasadenensis]|uniref:ABC transporter permease n=1 Tax=Paenibacillus pasadenensis TaxID=217090 RepID=UPI00203C1DF0|nr:ABC transporter permease [Paenibacillus pasadenensis]MCM3747653.1 ABC transporter permease [Paenibacillus pasadenensis]
MVNSFLVGSAAINFLTYFNTNDLNVQKNVVKGDHNVFVMKKLKFLVLFLTSLILINSLLHFVSSPEGLYRLQFEAKNKQDSYIQVYYGDSDQFSEMQSFKVKLGQNDSVNGTVSGQFLRIDLGDNQGVWQLGNMIVSTRFKSYGIGLEDTGIKKVNNISSIKSKNRNIEIIADKHDPNFEIVIPDNVYAEMKKDFKNELFLSNILISIIPGIIVALVIQRRTLILYWIREFYAQRHLIRNLSQNDFKTKYSGSYLGIFWAFVQPVATVLIYWFVFQIGFRSGPVQDAPYILWLIAGLVPWFFFSDAVTNGTYSLLEYNYLVKKIVFNINILPVVKLVSSLYVHIFFILLSFIVFGLYGYYPDLYYIQILYYSICMIVLAYALSLLTSSLILFLKDIGQFISIVLQFGMWLTPILWNISMMPQRLHWLMKLNPMFYVVEGYRDALIGHVWMVERYNQTIYFWTFTIAVLWLGTFIFKRLRPHFADVL